MWTQRAIRRRWPFARTRKQGGAPDTVSLLDTISLTALYTDPTPPEAPPGTSAGDLLATLSSGGSLDPDLIRIDEHPRLVEWERLPMRKIAVGLGCLALVSGSVAAGFTMAGTSASPPPAHVQVAESPVADRLIPHEKNLHLTPARSKPRPALPLVALAPPTSAHEVFGYAPYWSLPQASQFPVHDFSTIAYFSVDVNPDGTIETSGPGWDGYESQDLTDLVNAAHNSGDRVVLTATDFSDLSLYSLTHDASAEATLGTQLTKLVRDKNLDGVNLDLEGTGSEDQVGLDNLVSQVDAKLHASDPHYQLTMATYASSAGDPSGFYDIRRLSQYVDAFFVMAYDVDQGPTQGNGNGGGADAGYIAQYTSAVGASKVILGLPLFGYDEPTSGRALGDPVTGPSQPVTYAQAMASGPTRWDPATQTAWTSYRSGGQWHQVFFDNANTLAGKVQQAASAQLLGVGIWALGMEGDDDSILAVLDGGTPPLRTPPVGPVSRHGSASRGTNKSGSSTTTTTAAGQKHNAGAGSTTTTAPSGGGSTTTTPPPVNSTTTTVPPTTTTTVPPTTTTTVPPTTTTTVPPTTTTTTVPPTTTTTVAAA